MRRIVGALFVLAAALCYRGADLFHSWTPLPRAVPRPLERAGEAAGAGPAASPEPDTPAARTKETKPKPQKTRKAPPPDFIRNPLAFLSSAPKDSLALLPGVGPVIADRIIHARTGKRSFTKWEDLLAIKGIGPKTIERMKKLADAGNP